MRVDREDLKQAYGYGGSDYGVRSKQADRE